MISFHVSIQVTDNTCSLPDINALLVRFLAVIAPSLNSNKLARCATCVLRQLHVFNYFEFGLVSCIVDVFLLDI